MQRNKIVIQVPPDCLFTTIELDKIKKTGWEVNEKTGNIVRKIATVPIFGTKEMWQVPTPGDFLVFIEPFMDDLHQYAWNLYVMSERQYKEWLKNE